MRRNVLVVAPGQPPTWHEVEDYKDLQALVAGNIEAVGVSEHFDVYVNEEGKLEGMWPCMRWPDGHDTLVGAVIFDGLCDEQGENTQLAGEGLEKARAYIKRYALAWQAPSAAVTKW